jgi:hypothetical protein
MSKTLKPGSSKKNRDLPLSEDDKKHLQPDEGTLDLPDVKDIPGQEHVRPLPLGEMADTTISSADEEADNLFEEEEETIQQYDTNVTPDEKELLKRSSESMATRDDIQLQHAKLDSTDDEGIALNENTDQSGKELDVPGSEEDDANEEIGEEDEENNFFSLNDDKEDQTNTFQ